MSSLLKRLGRMLDLKVTRLSKIEKLKSSKRRGDDLDLLLALHDPRHPVLLDCYPKSKAQLRQDLFALSAAGFRTGGFFVEFGATNGVDLSNTHLLEKEFGWHGILAEPARCWHGDLERNRSAHVEKKCVWRETGSVVHFNEATIPELSTIDAFSDDDRHGKHRKDGRTYDVETISLNDLLAKYKAPAEMDYLSIDTEGSEFDILQSLDFDRYRFRAITCEHNHSPMRNRIHVLLTGRGYKRVLERFSQFDDWYVAAGD